MCIGLAGARAFMLEFLEEVPLINTHSRLQRGYVSACAGTGTE